MIYVIANIELEPGTREDYLREFHRLVPKVLQEDGCIEYGPTVDVRTDIEVQVPIREDVVTVVEKWESVDALKVHLGAPHMEEYRENVADFVKGAQIQVLTPA